MTYATRMARLPRLMDVLAAHPAGLSLDDAATAVGTDAETLRDDILTYYALEGPSGMSPPEGIEFFGEDGQVGDPETAPRVRVVGHQPESELGVEYLSANQLATLHRSGRSLLALEPDNVALREAVRILEDTFLQGLGTEGQQGDTAVMPVLRDAVNQRRRVRISYVRAWRPGAQERVIEPYRLVQTRRGWEVDARKVPQTGTSGGDVEIRTYLAGGIVTATVLDETFSYPPNLDERLRTNRTETEVALVVPMDRLWAVDRFAERYDITRQDDDADGDVELRARLLPPVPERLGLLLLVAGAEAFVREPRIFTHAARDEARRLLRHHESHDAVADAA